MSHNRYIDRRQFLQLLGLTGMTAMASTLPANIARALEIPQTTKPERFKMLSTSSS
jgi:Ni,Fe-hydrogenase I small subunit